MTVTTPNSTGTDPVADLRAAVAGLVVRPGEPGFERAIPWNVAASTNPRAAVFVESPADVAATLRIAAQHGLTVAVHATGHGALPLDQGSILVHTGALSELVIDPQARTARVGAGVKWQRVIEDAAPHGLAGLAGSAPDVGVVGFITGCGIGPFVRTVGLSSDHVRSFELVTGQGEILHVTPENHAELFWGLRGGKATLGIVTSVEIDLAAHRRVLRWCTLFRRSRRGGGPSRLAGLEHRSARARQHLDRTAPAAAAAGRPAAARRQAHGGGPVRIPGRPGRRPRRSSPPCAPGHPAHRCGRRDALCRNGCDPCGPG